MRTAAALTSAGVIAAIGVVAFGELSSWAASRRGFPRSGSETSEGATDPSASHAVLVLGYRNPGPRANAINRFRVRAGVRSVDPEAAESVLVLSGGAVAGVIPEAELMRRYARDELGFTGAIRLETASTSTEENIEQAIPLLEEATSIAVVSTSHHALKARICLRRLRPDLAERLVRGGDYRLGELWWVKPVEAVLGRRSLRRLTSAG